MRHAAGIVAWTSELRARALRDATRDPIVFVLGLAVLAGLVYAAILALFTTPNDWDAMTYHLARAAFWIQQHGLGYVPERAT